MTSRHKFRALYLSVSEICHRREATAAARSKPGTARLQVPTGQNVGPIRPPVGGLRWSPMKFVAIRRDD
jgi:hypothetical protein